MKNIKSLTYLLATILLSACSGHSSATFSSSSSIEPSSNSGSSIISSEISSDPISSSSSSSVASSEISSEIISSSSEETSSSSSSEESSSLPDYSGMTFYDGYYSSLTSWQNGRDLKNKLNAIIREGYTPLTYADNFATNINADHTKYDYEYLDVVYSDTNLYKTETSKGWQREHAFCASLMCGSSTGEAVKFKGRATDFHNLFASNASANGSRGNKNYGNADKTASNYTNRTSNNGYDGYSFAQAFEPGDKEKGRLARAIFYMATMYKDPEVDTVNNINMQGLAIIEDDVSYVAGNRCDFCIGHLSDLLSWNNNFDVDYLEMQHNISVYTSTDNPDGVAQGNRNPFIDYPELVDYVYGSKKNESGELKHLTPSCLALDCEKHELSHYALKEAKREYNYGEELDNDDYKIVKVYKDYTYENVSNAGVTHSLAEHVFSESDSQIINAYVSIEQTVFDYQVAVYAGDSTSTGEIFLSTTGINKTQADVDQEVTFGNIQFILNFSSSADISGATRFIQNISAGGITVGSGTYPLTRFTLTTKNSYEITGAFIKAFRGNADSSYQLTIKVGDEVLLDSTTVNSADSKQFGNSLATPLTGQLSFIFTGSSSLKINSIAFNAVIA